MKKYEKQADLILKRLSLVDKLTISDGAELLNITESSVRRIFAKMENSGLAIRLHGGLARLPQEHSSYSYSVEDTVNTEQKKKIAAAAAKFIADSRSVYLDSGSTLYRISLALSNFLNKTPCPNLKIFTNSLKNLEVLQGISSIRLSGGDYRASRRDFCGFLAETAVSRLNFDVCVLGADGVNASGDLTTTDFDTAKLCMSAINHSTVKILAVDSSKFGKTALVTYANISDISIVVTDSEIPDDFKKFLSDSEIKTVIV